jgi:hypothetical protein
MRNLGRSLPDALLVLFSEISEYESFTSAGTDRLLARCSSFGMRVTTSETRVLHIENVLYTISDGKIKMNHLESLAEIMQIELP